MKEREVHGLIPQPVRNRALIAVRQFENETRLACAPERRIKPIVTALPRIKPHRLAFTPDSKWLVVCFTTKVYVLSVSSGKCVQVLVPPKTYINTAAISPDGGRIATGDHRGMISLWDVHTGDQLWSIKGHERRGIKKVAFTPDNDKVLSITLGRESEIRVWDSHSGQLICEAGTWVRDFAIAPDSQTVIIVEGRFIRELDLHSGRYMREYACDAELESLALGSDGQRAVVLEGGRNEKFWVVDLPSGKTEVLDTGIHHESFALHPGGEMLIAPETDYDNRYHAKSRVCFWDLRTGARMADDGNEFRFPAAFSPDGQLMAALQGDALVFWELLSDSSVSVWRRDPVWQGQWEPALSLNGKWMATHGPGEGINLWDLQTGRVRSKLNRKLSKADVVAISPAGDTFAMTYWKGPIKVWNLASERLLHSWQAEKSSFSQPIAYHPNGRVIAYAGEGQITLRELGTGKVLQVLDTQRRTSKNLAFSRDGRSLVSEAYGHIYWWDVNTGRCILRPNQFKDYSQVGGRKIGKITAQLINPNDLTCIIAENHSVGDYDYEKREQGYAYLIHKLDLTTGRYIGQFEGDHNPASIIAPDPEWNTVVSGTGSGGFRKWDLRTGERLLDFSDCLGEGYEEEITFLQVSSDEKHLIACNKGGILNFWDYQSGELLATGYNLSEGHLWTTPPDEFAPNGWLFTDRPDLVSLLETNRDDGEKPEYVFEGDKRFDDYLQIYNDGEMVMARLNDLDRYRQMLQVRLGNKAAMEDHLLAKGKAEQRYLPYPKPEGDYRSN